MSTDRAASYGPWAVVAGASEGLGAAFAEMLAGEGIHLILVARREAVLAARAQHIRDRFGVSVHTVAGDLAAVETVQAVLALAADCEVGVLVYNAAAAPIGPFHTLDQGSVDGVVGVNVSGALRLVSALLPRMLERGHAGLILMSSLAGETGSPRIAAYAASKAFTTAFGTGLWSELRGTGVDVVTCIAGAITTPGLESASRGKRAPGTLTPERVARAAWRGLGRTPIVVPGLTNRIARFVMGRLLPRTAAVRIMEASTRTLGSPAEPGHDKRGSRSES